MSFRPALPLLLLAFTACGGADEVLPPDAAPVEPDATAVTCEPGATATATFGAAGGALSLCGARLAVDVDALADDVSFTITLVEPPEPAPFERAFAGDVFWFATDGDPLPALVKIDVPAADGEGYLYLARHSDGVWNTVEACRVDGGIIGQNVGVLGPFVAMRDTNIYPSSPMGLGEGTIDVTLDAVDYPFTLDAASRGYYDEASDGSRAITLYLWYTPTGGDLKVLDLTFAVPATGDPEVVAAAWTDLGGPDFSYINHLTQGTSAIALDAPSAPDAYAGTVDVSFVDDEAAIHTMHVAFDVTVEEYSFPPELSCPGEGGE